MHKYAILLSALLLTACVDSQNHGASQVLPADVDALPPGSAVGTGYTGRYLVGAGMEEWCLCRLGNSEDVCGTLRLTSGLVLGVEQNEGALSFSTDTATWGGGVNEDGAFDLGTVATITDSTGRDIGYTATGIEGNFSADVPTTMGALIRATLVYTTSTDSYDCDIGFSFTALRRE